MGSGRFTAEDWDRYTAKYTKGKPLHDVFRATSINPSLNPLGVKVRESRDSADNPQSHAIIVDVDVTGSMGILADAMVRNGCNVLATEIYQRKPVTDPHILFMANGDVEYDQAPLQITQFEADIRIAEQLKDIWLEGGGGGNNHESYLLPWYFGAMHTSIDCFEKRGKKGYLFTAGDEEPQEVLRASEIAKVFGTSPQSDYQARDLLTLVSRYYHVFHLIVEEGNYYQGHANSVSRKWRDLMGQRAIHLTDHTKMAEVIVSTIQVSEGTDKDTVAKSWDHSTALVVKSAISGLPTQADAPRKGLFRF